MLQEKHDPRAPGDRRMYLYFDYSPLGALRWYVKVSRRGRRIGIREEYRRSSGRPRSYLQSKTRDQFLRPMGAPPAGPFNKHDAAGG
jgi:hypothetical protein